MSYAADDQMALGAAIIGLGFVASGEGRHERLARLWGVDARVRRRPVGDPCGRSGIASGTLKLRHGWPSVTLSSSNDGRKEKRCLWTRAWRMRSRRTMRSTTQRWRSMPMSEPIFFLSHFRIKAGQLDLVRQLTSDVAAGSRRTSLEPCCSCPTSTRTAERSASFTRSRTPSRWTSTSWVLMSDRERHTNTSSRLDGRLRDQALRHSRPSARRPTLPAFPSHHIEDSGRLPSPRARLAGPAPTVRRRSTRCSTKSARNALPTGCRSDIALRWRSEGCLPARDRRQDQRAVDVDVVGPA